MKINTSLYKCIQNQSKTYEKHVFHLLVDQRHHKLFCLRACSGVIKKPDFLIFMARIWRATYAVLVFLKKRF